MHDNDSCMTDDDSAGGGLPHSLLFDGEDWIRVETTGAERNIGLSCKASWLQRMTRTQPWKLWLALGISGGLVYAVWWFAGFGIGGAEALLSGVLLILWGVLLCREHMVSRRAAATVETSWRCALCNEGLVVETSTHRAVWSWKSVAALEQRLEVLLVYLHRCQVLVLPYRCFASPEDYRRWLARLQQLSGLPAGRQPALPCNLSERRWRQSLPDFVRNLYAGLCLLLFRSSGVAQLRTSGVQMVLLAGSWLLVRGFADFSTLALEQGIGEALAGTFYGDGIVSGLAIVLLVLVCAWGVVRLIAGSRVPEAFLALALPLWWIAVGEEGLFWWDDSIWRPVLGWCLWGWALLAGAVALARTLELTLRQKVLAMLCIGLLYGAVNLLQADSFALWVPPDDADASAPPQSMPDVTHESVLYAQPELLENALEAVRPGRKGVPELYLLAYGGYGGQDVFLHEVESVEKLFAERFGTQNRSIVLVNSPQTIDKRPMATTIALREALDEIGRKMNREEDVLFLFMTSHGAQDHHFSLELGPYVFDELTPQVLRTMLDESGIRNRVILVSACYSGGFIHDLSSNNTLVMSASREDRSSHGCQQGADWTFFGKAYFDEALRHTPSFEKAFDEARAIVAGRERQEGVTPSEPQIAVGNGIRPVLTAWEKTLQPVAAR